MADDEPDFRSEHGVSPKHRGITKKFVLAAGVWFIVSILAKIAHQGLPEGISLASASIITACSFVMLSGKFPILKRNIILVVCGIGLAASVSLIPLELGSAHLDGAAVILSVVGVVLGTCALFVMILKGT